MSEFDNPSLSFGGIPIRVNPYMPENEVWLVQEGQRRTVHIHEGQQAGQTVEEWLTKPKIYRIVNLGDMFEWPTTNPSELKIGDWPWPEK